jgi:chromate transport protein ChrA
MNGDYRGKVILAIVYTSCFCVASVVIVLLVGLFSPRVDNNEIFKIIQPTFAGLIGSFIAIVAGQFAKRKDDDK